MTTGSREITCRCCRSAVDVCQCGWTFTALVDTLRHPRCHGAKADTIAKGGDTRFRSFEHWVESGLTNALCNVDIAIDEDMFERILFSEFGIVRTPDHGPFGDIDHPDYSPWILVDILAEAVAKSYMRTLSVRHGLRPGQLCKIAKDNEDIHPSCDAAHDYIDANEPMAFAMKTHCGKTPIDVDEDSLDGEVLTSVWNEAFNTAKTKLTYLWAVEENYLTFHPAREQIQIRGDFDAFDDHCTVETKADGSCLYDTLDDALHGHSWRQVWEVTDYAGIHYAHVPGLFDRAGKSLGFVRVRDGDVEENAYDVYVYHCPSDTDH